MIPLPPPTVANLVAFATFVERQEPKSAMPQPLAVTNDFPSEKSGWLYCRQRDHRDSIEVHDVRAERELLKALREVVEVAMNDLNREGRNANRRYVPHAVRSRADSPAMVRIRKVQRQDTLYREHLPVIAQIQQLNGREKPERPPGEALHLHSGT